MSWRYEPEQIQLRKQRNHPQGLLDPESRWRYHLWDHLRRSSEVLALKTGDYRIHQKVKGIDPYRSQQPQ